RDRAHRPCRRCPIVERALARRRCPVAKHAVVISPSPSAPFPSPSSPSSSLHRPIIVSSRHRRPLVECRGRPPHRNVMSALEEALGAGSPGVDDTLRDALPSEQIHALIMSPKFTGIEIKTAHSLESWNGGVLVMVSGLVQTKEFSSRRGFVQTFFLAPQEKGYFVLNDILHLQDEEQSHSHQTAMLGHGNFELNASTPVPEPGSHSTQGTALPLLLRLLPSEDHTPLKGTSLMRYTLIRIILLCL
ncbi:hypothetical protein Taro_018364, partial [Colocasia esculenta]|nr:hypothetical protein [Colocasia esculenta]